MINAIKLLRPHQYVKNIFVFAPIFFVGQFMQPANFIATLEAFIAFCFAASAIYILNDYLDIERDKAHPSKKNRPLAAGTVSKRFALILMLMMLFAAEGLAFIVSLPTLLVINAYLALNLAYCFGLKEVGLLDVTIIAIGFVLRLFAGSTAADVDLSSWIVVMTFLLALFLALAKRRDDILIYEHTGKIMRETVKDYNLKFLDSAISIMAAVIIVAYVSYTTSHEVVERLQSNILYCSVLFVILGLLRYLQLTLVFNDSGSPTKLALSDRYLQVIIIAWLAFFGCIIYW